MPSPPRPLRRSPPRKPLHERSDSSTNGRASPTIRIIGDPHAKIYSSTPFPTHPLHILSPKTARASGAVLEEVGVSNQHGRTLREPVSENDSGEDTRTTLVKAKKLGDSEDTSNASSLPSPRPFRHSRHLSPALDVSPGKEEDFDTNGRSFIMDQAVDEGRPSDEIVQLPSVDSGPDALGSHSVRTTQASYQQPVVAKSSDGSLSSAESTGTVIRTKPRDQLTRASYSAFPIPIRHEDFRANSSSASPSTPVNLKSSTSHIETSPVSPVSPDSPASSFVPASTSHRAVSLPPSDVVEDVSPQYPIVRPPTASESWAESSTSASRQPPARNPKRTRWNPHLSTVESVGMTDRSSGSLYLADSLRASRNSTRAPNSRSETPPLPAFPRSAHTAGRDTTTSTIRVVNEQDDQFHSNLAPVPGSRGSTRFSLFSGSSRGNDRRSGLQQTTRPSSRGSFFRDSIPAWARTYYGRGGRNSLLPQNYSTDNVQESGFNTEPHNTDHSTGIYTTDPSGSETSLHGIYQPQTRSRHYIGLSRNDSLPINRIRPSEIDLVKVRGVPRPKISDTWSPHLWQYRHSVPKRRSLFIAPAIDNTTVSKLPKRRNVQVVLFTVGFIFPLAWFAAALLPLPPRPTNEERGKGPVRRLSGASIAQDLENRLAPMDEAQYENARWWRQINRIMMIVGVFIIAAIIALAIVATRMKN